MITCLTATHADRQRRCIAAIGAGFYKTTPNHRPFSPVDPSISFPYVEKEKISTGVLVLIALIIPALITMVVALVFTPGSTVPTGTSKSVIWRQKLWEWNTAWMGLGLALVTTFFFTEGMKNVFGKPRPDLLARCNLDPATVQQYALGGFGTELPLWNLLVSATSCRQPDLSILNDGFASFPSGHASCKCLESQRLTYFFHARADQTYKSHGQGCSTSRSSSAPNSPSRFPTSSRPPTPPLTTPTPSFPPTRTTRTQPSNPTPSRTKPRPPHHYPANSPQHPQFSSSSSQYSSSP